MANFWQNLPKPFTILAPMDDVTDVVFRTIVNDVCRPNVFFTEFTSSDALCSRGKDNIIHKLKYEENQRPIVAQIWGTNPEFMYEAAKIVQELGFDGIDINMGCPVRAVVRRGAGAGHIEKYENSKDVIDALKRGAPKLPISVKTRLGIKSIMTDEWISFLLEQNLDALTIHGRTAKQMSKGEANWEEIGKAVELKNKIAPQTILIGNGDIQSYDQVLEMHQTYGVDGVMIGRGIFSNLWIFEKDKKTHTKEEAISILLNHVDLYTKTWGNTKTFAKLKKFFKIYIKDFDGANELRIKLMECNNQEDVKKVIDTL
jgi:nifR3 family TIM-barrel protein